MHFLKLIRFQNLLFIAFVQVLIKYSLFPTFEVNVTLNAFGFGLLIFSTLCIAAAGYIINDIYDLEIDRINKPDKTIIGKKISEKTANTLFIILNIIGVGIGFYLSNLISKPGFSALFIIISALLYLYASHLKGIILVGNLVVSALIALSIIIVGLFDLLPVITPENQVLQSTVFGIIADYALFAFLLNFIREIVKDLEDINGDKNGGLNTLPIALGRKRTVQIVFGLGVLVISVVVFYMYSYFYRDQTLVMYFLFCVIAPLLYFCVKAWEAKTKKEFSHLSTVLKIIMLLGICSIFIYPIEIIQ